MTALSVDEVTARMSWAFHQAFRDQPDGLENITFAEAELLAGVAARVYACIRADHPQAVPWCLACGDENCLTHCIYCAADCSLDVPAHLPHCPSSLHMWPACPDMVCARCSGDIGPYYAHQSTSDTPGDTTVLMVCLGCSALNEDR